MSNNRLLLVDTPGFDDSEGLSDQDIVDQIIRWIQDYCGRGNATVKCGVILLQEEKQRDCYQGGPNLVRHLETALHRYRAAVLTIMTNDKVRNGGQDVYKYSGRTYGVSEVTTFCHEQLGRILGAGLPAKDLLAELAEARKVVRGSTGKRSIIARFMNRLKKAFS
ncbi:hypothetical protein CC1G_12076 [Coprinopsis cinerea okayama7|uniref:G domain-containing protein n=1 Tax=Coprinopsis cinerea (strain Okayama-7 / 130 / ATCC MYA-4618 / FGSC 9003) TaxID=240176 RepID=A8N0E5_COPC7|nr:hypothetical protein CC1G_12076 [Coprinopsis cinerea okayama7\|eukprot:XP_001828346.2 hypothetical protein CC1G_12076 [Coprinopsis cinerea okayama7\